MILSYPKKKLCADNVPPYKINICKPVSCLCNYFEKFESNLAHRVAIDFPHLQILFDLVRNRHAPAMRRGINIAAPPRSDIAFCLGRMTCSIRHGGCVLNREYDGYSAVLNSSAAWRIQVTKDATTYEPTTKDDFVTKF